MLNCTKFTYQVFGLQYYMYGDNTVSELSQVRATINGIWETSKILEEKQVVIPEEEFRKHSFLYGKPKQL